MTTPSESDRPQEGQTERSEPSDGRDERRGNVRRVREMTTAAIALLVIAGTIALIGTAITQVGDSGRFGRVKDLLLFVNPLLGYVIGYYFNRVSTEGRAEQAEDAVQASRQTIADATRAQTAAQNRELVVTAALAELVGAHGQNPPSQVLGDGEDEPTSPELLSALDRARSVLAQVQSRT